MIMMIQLGIKGVFKVFPTILIQTFAVDQQKQMIGRCVQTKIDLANRLQK